MDIKIHICFKDKEFIDYTFKYSTATTLNMNNYLIMIRDYFILDVAKDVYDKYREKFLFDEIQKEMKREYPSLKEKYHEKNIFSKIYNFLFVTGYALDKTNETMKEIFKNYNNNKKEDEKKGLI